MVTENAEVGEMRGNQQRTAHNGQDKHTTQYTRCTLQWVFGQEVGVGKLTPPPLEMRVPRGLTTDDPSGVRRVPLVRGDM